MLRLDTTTRKLEVVLGGAVTTNQLPITASWSDASTGAYLGGCTVINTNSGTAVTAVAAPAAGTVRDIDFVNVYNADTVNATVTVRYNDNATLYTEVKITLTPGDTLRYTHADAWKVVDSNGSTKFSINNVTGNLTVGGTLTVTGATTLQSTLSLGGNVTLGANYISYGGTNAGLSLDASNNATLSGNLTVSGTGPHAIGGATASTDGLKMQSVGTGVAQTGFRVSITGDSSGTTSLNGLQTNLTSASASYTVADVYHFRVGNFTKGTNSSITRQTGFQCPDLTEGSSFIAAFRGQVTSGTGKWNVYVDGSAGNYFGGPLQLASLGSFSAGDKYLIVDASGNVHVSATGPAS